MATRKKQDDDTVEAFVLVDCAYGKCMEVVTLSKAEAETGAADGCLDLNPDAIKAHKKG